MNLETQGLQPATLDNSLNLPEKSSTELEAENFTEYVADALRRKLEITLADLVENGDINIGIHKNKAIETGKLAERSKGDKYDSSDHIQMRAEMVADELIKNKKEYLN